MPMGRPRLPREGTFGRYKADRKKYGPVADFVYAREKRNGSKKRARGEAIEAAALHFGKSERSIERILAKFAPMEAAAAQVLPKLATFAPQVDSVMQHFTPNERAQILSDDGGFDFPTLKRIADERVELAAFRRDKARLRARNARSRRRTTDK